VLAEVRGRVVLGRFGATLCTARVRRGEMRDRLRGRAERGLHALHAGAMCEGGPGVLRGLLPVILFGVACSRGDPASPDPAPAGQITDALDPESCRPCHADHVRAWSGSMHAYASDDPVFRAMNALGQRETGGALGRFCVQCHAPVAARRGDTKDGSNLAALPPKVRGVTCVSCHTVDAIEDVHDGALHLADDGTFRGPIADVAPGAPHGAAYSPLHDRARPESALLCGACHDVRTQRGVDAERTFAEWQTTIFAQPADQKTCGNCHMPATHAPAASGGPVREVHDHAMAAVDLARTPFPETDSQEKAVRLALDSALSARLCVTAPSQVEATLENARIGHAWPTGAAHDRRAWLELVAYAGGQVVWSTPQAPTDQPPADPSAFVLGETLLAAGGAPARFLWEAEATRSNVLAPAEARTLRYTVPADVDRVTMRLRVTPFDPAILASLVATGDLDPAVRIPVFDLATTTLEWTQTRGFACLP
jgi:hypothetical protein